MPRTARIVLPNHPHPIVQRGHNRQVVFAEPEDFRRYLHDLVELKTALGVKLYAWCLMTNHVHLLLDPGDDPTSLARLMKALAARATRWRNRLEGRSGTLWESRYKSSVVQSDGYLLNCCRYIELNPLRAGMVQHAADYPWSSLPARLGNGEGYCGLDLHPQYLALGPDRSSRARYYAELLQQPLADDDSRLIREALQRGQLTGNPAFVDQVAAIIGRRIEHRGRGRPAAGN